MTLLYQEVTDFVDRKTLQYSHRQISSLDGQVPLEVRNALQQELQLKYSSIYNQSKQAALVKHLYDAILDWKLKQIKHISELIGDVPKYAIGSELRSKNKASNDADEVHSLSLDKLIEDVLKLPKMTSANKEDADIDERELAILQEYNNIKDDLTHKCYSIRYGEAKITEIEDEVTKLEAVIDSIKKYNDGASSVSEYLNSYPQQVSDSLLEVEQSLELALKKSTDSPDQRAELFAILTKPQL